MTVHRSCFTSRKTCYLRLDCKTGQWCFFDAACFDYFLVRLRNFLSLYRTELHAYALLPDSIHLLLTPVSVGDIDFLLRAVTSAYTHYFNIRFRRRSVLINRDYYCSPLSEEQSAINWYILVETKPEKHGLVALPGEYKWSSYCINAFGGHGNFITMHKHYRKIGNSPGERFKRYREYIASTSTSIQEYAAITTESRQFSYQQKRSFY